MITFPGVCRNALDVGSLDVFDGGDSRCPPGTRRFAIAGPPGTSSIGCLLVSAAVLFDSTLPVSGAAAPSVVADAAAEPTFAALGLPRRLLHAVTELGYITPTAIQTQAIPALVEGHDVAGVAQTGTGKTAAFGLPLLAAVDPNEAGVQALVLAPTRELAMQVADALVGFAAYLPGLRVVPVYGGAPFGPQRAALAGGAQVVVGTPGRVIDHLDRGTLNLAALRFLVLDEADEMLKMGFAEDVDRILTDAPAERQTALFSATMPPAIRAVAAKHLTDPVDISVTRSASTVGAIKQTYAVLPFRAKVDALTRVLETTEGDAAIVFVRTKGSCDEVGAELVARGVSAAAINGDVPQKEREKIIERLRSGQLDVLVATDVAARGLDVDRIDLVVNFDAPTEPETYVHRIGRTGRAGRTGTALTFFTPREVTRLRGIERATRTTLEQVVPPTAADVAAHRATEQLDRAAARLSAGRLDSYRGAVARFTAEHDLTTAELAAVLLAVAAGDDGVVAEPEPESAFDRRSTRRADVVDDAGFQREPRRRRSDGPAGPRYRVAVGRDHGVRPAGIVGAITGEGGIAGSDLGRIDIFDSYSTVEISAELSPAALRRISAATVSGQKLRMQLDHGPAPAPRGSAGPRNSRDSRPARDTRGARDDRGHREVRDGRTARDGWDSRHRTAPTGRRTRAY
jgi:ATP-dependent RNA helicase DeaD